MLFISPPREEGEKKLNDRAVNAAVMLKKEKRGGVEFWVEEKKRSLSLFKGGRAEAEFVVMGNTSGGGRCSCGGRKKETKGGGTSLFPCG